MPRFVYRLAAADGSTVEGEIDGVDPEALRARLEVSGAVVLSLRRGIAWPRFGRKLSDEDMAAWCWELAVLLRVGVPMVDALELARGTSRPLAALTERLVASIREGSSLSIAASAEPAVFTPFILAALRAGERGGDLPRALERLAEHMRHRLELVERIRSALLYPAVLACLATGVLVFLIGYVVPSFAGVLADSHARLPALTRFVLELSRQSQEKGPLLLLAFCFLGALATGAYRRAETGKAIDRALCAVPWFGLVVLRTAMSAWAQTLSMLIHGQVPLAEALVLAAKSVTNRHVASRLEELAGKVTQGESLTRAAARTGVLSDRTVRMIGVGAETGELGRLLDEVARLEGHAARSSLETASRLLEPVLMVLMGSVVALILAAMFLPIVELAATL